MGHSPVMKAALIYSHEYIPYVYNHGPQTGNQFLTPTNVCLTYSNMNCNMPDMVNTGLTDSGVSCDTVCLTVMVVSLILV